MTVPKKMRSIFKKIFDVIFLPSKTWFLIAGGSGIIQTIEKMFWNPDVSVSWLLLFALMMGVISSFLEIWRDEDD